MNKFIQSMLNLSELEQLAKRAIWPNDLHPTYKILWTLVYIIMVTSVHKYNLVAILYFGIYPLLMIGIIDMPLKSYLSKLMIPAFFGISLGLANPFMDHTVVAVVSDVQITGGVISLMTLLLKAIWSISATMILVSTTSVEALGKGLKTLKVPERLIVLLLLIYRYIAVLLNEVSRTIEAYQLRGKGRRAIHFSAWGSLVGQIMIRSYRRSEEIYNAMLLRGYRLGEQDDA